MNILIHLVTAFWVVYIAVLFLKDRLRAIVNPLLQFAVAQVVYFASPPDQNGLEVGLLLALTSMSILAGFALGKGNTGPKEPPARVALVDRYPVMVGFLSLAIGICVLVPILGLLQGISLFEILTSFYTMRGMAQVSPIVAVTLKAMTKIPFIALILGRIWFHTSGSGVIRVMWYILFFVQLLLTFGSGVRSGLVFLFACVVIADAYVLAVMGVRMSLLRKLQIRTFYVGVAACAVFGIMFLTAFRSVRFSSFSELVSAAGSLFQVGGGQEALTDATSQNINSAVAFCIRYYSENPQTLQGVYAQVVNPIPRFLWPNKPVGFGKVLAHDFLGASYDDPLSLAAGMGGEGFYNLGWAGGIVFPFLFGVVGGYFYRSILTKPKIGTLSCMMIFIAWGTGISRGDWLSALNVLTYQILVFFPLMWGLRMMLGQPYYVEYATKWDPNQAPIVD